MARRISIAALLACLLAAGALQGCKSGGAKANASSRMDALEQENHALRERLAQLQDGGAAASGDGARPRTAPVLDGGGYDDGPLVRSGDPTSVHVVQRGETLSGLARRYYGNPGKWRVIYDANRGAIGHDSNRLMVGTQLVIPTQGAG